MTVEMGARPFSGFSEYQAEVPLARELPYWDLMNDLVVLGDGSLALGLRLRGLTIETLDTDQINRMTTGLRAMLNSLPDGCEVSFVSEVDSNCDGLISAHAALRPATMPNTAWVADCRIAALREEIQSKNLLKPSIYAFVYRRFDPAQKSGGISFLKSFLISPKKFHDIKREEHATAERDLRQVAESFRERLEGNGITAKPLTGDECRELIYRFLNPKRSMGTPVSKADQAHREQEFLPEEIARVNALAVPSPREQLIFSDVILGYDAFFADGFYHRCMTLKTLPEFTHAALVSRLMQLPFPHLLHVHVQVPEQSGELTTLQAKRRMAHSMSISHGGRASGFRQPAEPRRR